MKTNALSKGYAARAEEERKSLESRLLDSKKLLDDANSLLATTKKRYSESQSELESFETRNKSLSAEVERLTIACSELRMQKEEFQASKARADADLKSARESNSELQQHNRALHDGATAHVASMNAVQAEKHTLMDQVHQLKARKYIHVLT